MGAGVDVCVAEGTFGVFDRLPAGYESPIATADWSNGLIATMTSGAMICAGINRGNVRVAVEVLTGAPRDTQQMRTASRCRVCGGGLCGQARARTRAGLVTNRMWRTAGSRGRCSASQASPGAPPRVRHSERRAPSVPSRSWSP